MHAAYLPSSSARLFSFMSVTPCLSGRGLCLNSTATQHTFAGVLLWLPRSTHQG